MVCRLGPSCRAWEGSCLQLAGPCSRSRFSRRPKHTLVVFLQVSGKGLLTVPRPQTCTRICAARLDKCETQPLPPFSPDKPTPPRYFLVSSIDVAVSTRGGARLPEPHPVALQKCHQCPSCRRGRNVLLCRCKLACHNPQWYLGT